MKVEMKVHFWYNVKNKQMLTKFPLAEWWLVENDSGAQGYAPAAYLTKWPQTL